MRIFVALDLTPEIRQRLERFVAGVENFAPEARWVRPESLHVTLKFIGEKDVESVEKIKQVFSSIHANPITLNFSGYGFFPTSKAPRVFWAGIEAEPELTALAKQIDEATATVGVAREDHPYSPHLTLARAGSQRSAKSSVSSGAPQWQKGDSPNQRFAKLQEKLSSLPALEFGTMTAHEFFLYKSQLLRGGSRYTKIGQFALTPQE
ncbi:MAG TPA: RNA 2',3'-cyclic phosphodiesterase [Terriglobales bacterium]|jgi:2'-5' RNA ligase